MNTRQKKNAAKHEILQLYLNETTSQKICEKTRDLVEYMTSRRTLDDQLLNQIKMSFENIVKTVKRKLIAKYNIHHIGCHLIKDMLTYNNCKKIKPIYVHSINQLLCFMKFCIDLLSPSIPILLHIDEWVLRCAAIRNLTMGIMGYNVQHFSPNVISCLINQPLLRPQIKYLMNVKSSELVNVLSLLNSIQCNDCLKIRKTDWILTAHQYDMSLETKKNIQFFLNNFIL